MGCGSSTNANASEPSRTNEQSGNSDAPQQKQEVPFKGRKVTIHYFNFRGRAEFIRILLAEGGVENTRRDVEVKDWPQLKGKEFGGNALPCLQINNQKLYQSNAIARSIAAKTGHAGKDFVEMGQVDMMADTVQDIIDGAFESGPFAPGTDEEKAANFKAFAEGKLKTTLQLFEKFIKQNKTGWLVGNSVTWADIKLYGILESMALVPGGAGTDLFKSSTGVFNLYNKVASLPRVAEYIKTRPETPM